MIKHINNFDKVAYIVSRKQNKNARNMPFFHSTGFLVIREVSMHASRVVSGAIKFYMSILNRSITIIRGDNLKAVSFCIGNTTLKFFLVHIYY